MSLFITSINSGSNGNCYYVGNSTEAVLVDVGISCKEVEQRLKQLNLSIQIVKAIFISHEHTDHIKGVSAFAKKYSLPVYITLKTRRKWIKGIQHLFRNFEATQPISIGELTITPFSKKHDAIDPHSFIISCKSTTVGVFTDIGTVCESLIFYFKQCHAAFLESNYDKEMLENGRYPQQLKNRIKGGEGHLSNEEALTLFRQHPSPYLSHLILSHLSKENNSPKLVEELFTKHAGDTIIFVASRYEPSPIFEITSSSIQTSELMPISRLKKMVQLGLFQ